MRDLNKLVRNGKQIGGIRSDLKPEQQVLPGKVRIRRKPSPVSGLPESPKLQVSGPKKAGMKRGVDDGSLNEEWSRFLP